MRKSGTGDEKTTRKAPFTASLYYALRGLQTALRERNMRIHLCFVFYVLLGGFVTELTLGEWAVVTVLIALVLAAECVNTAIEKLCDTLHPEYSEGIGAVKDLSAAAVLICAVAAAITGCVIFFGGGKPARALALAREYPAAVVLVSASLSVWQFIIFGRQTNDK